MCHSVHPYDVGLISTLLVVVGDLAPDQIVCTVPATLVNVVVDCMSTLLPDLIDTIPDFVDIL
tara:strand:+ start:1439 stop:1627 length:189 start_codon:yes stop_codon:yes gene_type:complete